MKILSISDEPVDLVYSPAIAERFHDVDLVLSCGDLPIDYLEYVATMLRRRLFYVNGNHVQRVMLTSSGEEKTEPLGCTNLHRRVMSYKGLLLAGLEGSMRYRNGEHQYSELEMRFLTWTMSPRLCWQRRRRARPLDILITHAPPSGIHDAEDLAHHGFESFLTFMKVHRPRLLIHGHTHLYRQDAHRVTRYLDTTVVNTFGYQLIEIDETDPTSLPKVTSTFSR